MQQARLGGLAQVHLVDHPAGPDFPQRERIIGAEGDRLLAQKVHQATQEARVVDTGIHVEAAQVSTGLNLIVRGAEVRANFEAVLNSP